MTADRLQSIKDRAAAAGDPEFWADFYNTTFSTEVDSPTATFIAASRQDVEWLLGEVQRLTYLLGSHADGHRCTCVMTDPGNPFTGPPEWEQDEWCMTHPNMDAITAEHRALQARLDAVEAALATHPEVCGQYADEDAITCGWKRAVEDITAAIRRKR